MSVNNSYYKEFLVPSSESIESITVNELDHLKNWLSMIRELSGDLCVAHEHIERKLFELKVLDKKLKCKKYFDTITKFQTNFCNKCGKHYKRNSFANHLKSIKHNEF